MAPNLAPSKHILIQHMIEDGGFQNQEIEDAASCTVRSVKAIRRNLRLFGSTTAPSNRGGRPRSITPVMLESLLQHLGPDSDRYLEEMVAYFWKEFGVVTTKSSISRTLRSVGWSKKNIRRVAKERSSELRNFYLYKLSSFHSYQVVYVDESGCDTRAGFRRTGWSNRGTTPVQVASFHRGQRYQILPAYTQDGILLSRVFQGSTDRAVFEDFIEQLLHHCGKWPEPKSVLIMDNASFHRGPRIRQMCDAAGVKLLYLPPYSPDLNPIEEQFAELKALIKKDFHIYEANPDQGFDTFLQWCVDKVGRNQNSARGHFRHAGWAIEEPLTEA
jgi:transposase